MTSLTVFLSPGDPADGVLAGLADLSAAGLVDEFAWIRLASGRSQVNQLILVSGGVSREVSVAELVTNRRITLLRSCTLIPLSDSGVTVDVPAEVALTNGLGASTGAKIVRSRFLLLGPDGAHTDPRDLVLEGWHNVLVSPEDSRAPQFGRIATSARPDAADYARFAAPTLAGLCGIWQGVDHSPLDDEPVLPGRVVRLARSFYRRLRTDQVEARLRTELLAQGGRLPLPSDPHSAVVPINDPAPASHFMSGRLWEKHAAVLKGHRYPYETHAVQEQKLWVAIKMFFGFLWAAMKNAPGAWYRNLVDNVAGRIAASAQRAIYTDAPSAYEIVVRGRRANGEHAGWRDVDMAVSQVAAMSTDQVQHAPDDLSPVWQDYANGSFALADAGIRGGQDGLHPPRVGAARGAVHDAACIVPGPAERFTKIPGVVAAAVRIDGVDGTDVLGIADLRSRLAELQADPDLALAAGQTLKDLDAWYGRQSRSYGGFVGVGLADAHLACVNEIRNLWDRLAAPLAAEPDSGPIRLARWAQILMALWVVLTGVFVWLGVAGHVKWWVSTVVVIGALAALLIGMCVSFLRSQRDQFARLNARKKAVSDRNVDEQNLAQAYRDHRRLSQAYGQYLSWSRVLGSFLASPLGPVHPLPPAPLTVDWGMPMSTAVGTAHPGEEQIQRAAGYLRRDLYPTGWLTAPWENLILSSAAPSDHRRQPTSDSSPLWRELGEGSGSELDRWADALFAGQVTSTGAEVQWAKTLHLLSTTMQGLADELVGTVQVIGGHRQTLGEFLGGLDQQAPPAGNFAEDVLTDTAIADAATAVATDHRRSVRQGLGLVCVATQFSRTWTSDLIVRADRTGSAPADPVTMPEAPHNVPAPRTAPTPESGGIAAPGLGEGFQF